VDYLRVVDELIGGWDLSTEAGRKKAYEKCEDYADEHFRKRRDFNAFMEVVWTRRIRDENGRLFLFTLTNDEGAEQRFGFDLDDPQVLFFSRQDLAGVSGDA